MNKLLRSGFIGLALTAVASMPAYADDVTMRPYLSESLMYTFADSSRHSDNGIGAMLGGGIPINRLLNIEMNGGYSHYNNNSDAGSSPWSEYLAKVDTQLFYSRDPAFSPYFGVGLGYAKEILKNIGNNGAFMADAGVGAIHYFKLFNTDFGVRGDVRYRWVDTDSSKFPGRNVNTLGEPVISLGLLIPLAFGGTNAVAPEVLPPAPPPVPVQPSLSGANHRFEDVHFAFDKYNLTEYAQASLDSDVTSINKLSGNFPSLKVDISGHTDWIGTDAYNQALSERRATAVKDYLVRKGIDAGRIRTYAYGESQPVAPNTTAEGRALNRRAEISTKGE
ncbi:MAG: OmpA family protein [Nevskia sp.]|nr:OmpA family protein [Nevskia sp.]